MLVVVYGVGAGVAVRPLPALEFQFSHTVVAHDAALVHIGVHTVYAALAGILPDDVVAVVGQLRLAVGILGYHQFVVVHTALQKTVVEIGAGVEQGLLVIGFFHQLQKFQQRVAEHLGAHVAGLLLNVYHRYQVLVAGAALGHEVVQLQHLGHIGVVEVVGAHFQTIAVGQVYVALVGVVLQLLSFRGLEVYIVHVAVVAKGLPEHVALIVAHVQTVYVVAGVFALYAVVLRQRIDGGQAK